jgi:hypothetical protein
MHGWCCEWKISGLFLGWAGFYVLMKLPLSRRTQRAIERVCACRSTLPRVSPGRTSCSCLQLPTRHHPDTAPIYSPDGTADTGPDTDPDTNLDTDPDGTAGQTGALAISAVPPPSEVALIPPQAPFFRAGFVVVERRAPRAGASYIKAHV